MLLILVQIQAGPPAFAAIAATARRARMPQNSSTRTRTCRAEARRAKAEKCRLMAALKPFRGCEIWSKDGPAREGKPGALARGKRGKRDLFFVRVSTG